MSFLREGGNEQWARALAQPIPKGIIQRPYPETLADVINLTTGEPQEGWIDVTKQADNGVVLNPTVEAGVVNALQEECGRTAAEHGFSRDWEMAKWLEDTAEHLATGGSLSADECDKLRIAAGTLRTNILGTKLMLIVSELSEALESLRHNGGAEGALEGEGNFHEELADAIVRILDTGTFTRGNLGDELLHKMAVNRGRPYLHGNKEM